MDCTDTPISEPTPLYEVAISLPGNIVLCGVPYATGEKSDLQIHRQTLRHYLELREVIIGDSAYSNPTCVNDDGEEAGLVQALRNRQETIFFSNKTIQCVGL